MKKKTKKTAQTCCGPSRSRGETKVLSILAGLAVFVVFFTAAVVVTQACFRWKSLTGKSGRTDQAATVENLQAQIAALKKQVNELKIKEENPARAENIPAGTVSQRSTAFEKAINDKDFAKVETLMADSVYYVIDASDCCGDISKKEAANNLQNYIRGVKSFDFDQDQQIVKQMKVNLAGTFARYIIGVADNKMVLSYQLDKQGKVDNLLLSASHLMYDLE